MEITINVSPILIPLNNQIVTSGKTFINLLFNDSISMFTTNDTNSKNPKLMINENDKNRLVSNLTQPLLGFAFTLQIIFNES